MKELVKEIDNKLARKTFLVTVRFPAKQLRC